MELLELPDDCLRCVLTWSSDGLFPIEEGRDIIKESVLWMNEALVSIVDKTWFDETTFNKTTNQSLFPVYFYPNLNTKQRSYRRGEWIRRAIREVYRTASVCKRLWDLIPWTHLHKMVRALLHTRLIAPVGDYNRSGFTWRLPQPRDVIGFLSPDFYRRRLLQYYTGFPPCAPREVSSCGGIVHEHHGGGKSFIEISAWIDEEKRQAHRRWKDFHRTKKFDERPRRLPKRPPESFPNNKRPMKKTRRE
jgi:hypothetical protein